MDGGFGSGGGAGAAGGSSSSSSSRRRPAGPHPQFDESAMDVDGAGGLAGGRGMRKPAPATETDFFLNPAMYDPGADVLHDPTRNAEGITTLYTAAKEGHEEAVAILLGCPRTQVNALNKKGVSALSMAAQRGHERIVRMLIDGGADVNAEANTGSTPLIQASHFGYAGVVRQLIQANSLVDKPNNKGTTALMRATQEGNEEVVRILIESGADVSKRNNERMNALMLGSQRGHSSIVRMLIEHNAEIDGTTFQGSTALMLACKRGHVEVVTTLLESGAEINMKDSRGRTARETALRRSFTAILQLLNRDTQMRLMQNVACRKRIQLLRWAYRQHGGRERGRGPQARKLDLVSASTCQSLKMLGRSMQLTRPLFERVMEFLPLPRLWQGTVVRLRNQCHIDADEAIRGAVQLMNEVFNDALQLKDADLYLVQIARCPDLAAYIEGHLRMPKALLKLVIDWSDAQSILSRLNREVSFELPAAEKAVYASKEVLQWYTSLEFGLTYIFQPNPINERCISDDVIASTAAVEAEIAALDSESSDGEMEV